MVELKDVSNPVDHRTQMGHSRRAKMRQHLLISSLDLYADQPDAELMIDDLIKHAGVSRGTFYNYFKTTHELTIALTGEMSDEILKIIDPYIIHYTNPLERMSMGLRLYMHATTQYPVWGKLLTRMGPHHTVRERQIDIYVKRDLDLAINADIIPKDDVAVLKDLILGAVYYGIETLQQAKFKQDYANKIIEKLLKITALNDELATRFAYCPLIKIEKVETDFFSFLKNI